jgi:hypothetical protein
MRQCRICGLDKPLEDFPKVRDCKEGRQSFCKTCKNANHRAWRARNLDRERQRESANEARRRAANPAQHARNALYSRARRLYGMSGEDVMKMLEDQNGKCPICQNAIMWGASHGASRMVIDHCHESGQVRGLLCDQCNKGLGLLKDSPDLLASALTYLAGM